MVLTTNDRLRKLGLFDARAPRYTSYPPANHFHDGIGPSDMAHWLEHVRPGSRVSLYLHIPYCRRLCWFCACRTQGTKTDRPLANYLTYLKAELGFVASHLPRDVKLSNVHLGGGTPTLLPPELIRELGGALKAFRHWSDDVTVSVEIDPTEVDQSRIDALIQLGMTRASIGVQDFDPVVQDCIGRVQSFEQTQDVVTRLRDAGLTSLNMDVLYGLPHQTQARISDSMQRILSLSPDRIALYGYAHVPWMAKRQVMIPSDALPKAEDRLTLFETARRLLVWDGYSEIGIDHYARPTDSLAIADREKRMHRNFQGYTDDDVTTLIGLGASAISRFEQGYIQNHSTSSKYADAISAGRLASARGYALSPEDALRADMINQVMCRFEIDFESLASAHGLKAQDIYARVQQIPAMFEGLVDVTSAGLKITGSQRLIARLVAQSIDTFAMPEGRHSRAL